MADLINALLFWMDVVENPGQAAMIFAVVVFGALMLAVYLRVKTGGVLVYRSSITDDRDAEWRSVERPPEVSLYRRGVLVTYQVPEGQDYDPERLRRLRLTAAERQEALSVLGVDPHWSSLVRRREPGVALRTVRRGKRVFQMPRDCQADPVVVRERLLRLADQQAARSDRFKPSTWVVRLVPTQELAGRPVQRWTVETPLDDFGHALAGRPGVRCRTVNSVYASDLAAALAIRDPRQRPVYAVPHGYLEITGRGLLDDEYLCPCEAQRHPSPPDAPRAASSAG